jgi:hypothetical protein
MRSTNILKTSSDRMTAKQGGSLPVRTVVSVLVVVAAMALVVGVGSAGAATPIASWSVQTIVLPSSLSAADNGAVRCRPLLFSGCDRLNVVATNIGTRPTSGLITVRDVLPVGIRTSHTPVGEDEQTGFAWACTTEEVEERELITCTSERSVPALTAAPAVVIPLTVEHGPGELSNSATVSGGEAVEAEVTTALPIEQPLPTFEPEGFGFSILGNSGLTDTQAASHPGAFFVSFHFPSAISLGEGNLVDTYPLEDVKNIVTDLPVGVVGDALATPTCPLTDVTNLTETETQCPASSHVGTLVLTTQGTVYNNLSIFNVTPEHGYPAEFAVFLPSLNRAVLLYASLVGSGANAHVRVTSAPQPRVLVHVVGISLTFFGNPTVINGTPFTSIAFAANPSDCEASDFTATMYVNTWRHPGKIESDGQPDLADTENWKSASSTLPPVAGCEALQFHPSLSFAPEEAHGQADEPSGYDTTLQVPQNEDPNGLATPPLETTTVSLPVGVAISPAAATGLVGCGEGAEGIGLESEAESSQPGHCPDASKVGTAKVITPLLKEPLEGGVFVAQPSCSPCSEAQAEKGEVFALYLEVGSPVSGVHVKLRGKVEVGGNGHNNGLSPGQVRAQFAQTPQQPFSELQLDFNGGPRAPLANPQSCGSFASTAELEPWSHAPAPGEREGTPNVTLAPVFAVSGGCGNGFAPSFSAGTADTQAGGFSPFVVTFSRHDGEQDLSGVEVKLPPGLIGKVAGFEQCPEVAANAGTCATVAPGSRVGTVTASAGSGSEPFWQSGSAYLTGPYKGGPFGLSVVVPAVAGPYNLGNIVVRAAIYVDPSTAQVTVRSDALPQSVDGVPLRVQTVNVTVGEGDNFTFNPTNCTASSVGATLSSVQGATAPVASRFQAANCASLPFRPVLTAATQGKTSKANGASLSVTLHSGVGQANIGKVSLELPKQLPARLTTIQKACTEAQFNLNPAGCPEASVIGVGKAVTPLLNVPLVGPAYFVSHGGAAFPDVEFILQGEGVVIVLDGKTQIKKGVTYSHFETVPDAPISTFETTFPEGRYSVLATDIPTGAKSSLCGLALSLPTTITGQNGAVLSQATKASVTGCAKAKTKTLTRAQKLAKALEACKKDSKKAKRAGCERSARKEYGPLTKKKTSKKKTTSTKK